MGTCSVLCSIKRDGRRVCATASAGRDLLGKQLNENVWCGVQILPEAAMLQPRVRARWVTVWCAFAVSRSHHVPRKSLQFPGPEELNIRDSQVTKSDQGGCWPLLKRPFTSVNMTSDGRWWMLVHLNRN